MPEQINPYDSLLPSSLAVWLTTADQTLLLQRQTDGLRFADNANDFPVITVDAGQKYQVMEGFGFSLTGGSAMLISRLPAPDRSALLRELFLPGGDGIGVSFLRLSIGASDLSERCFTYNDRPDGQPDPELVHFDIEAGDLEVIPLLREILADQPRAQDHGCGLVGADLDEDQPEFHRRQIEAGLLRCLRRLPGQIPESHAGQRHYRSCHYPAERTLEYKKTSPA